MNEDDTIGAWTLPPNMNRSLRLSMIEKCREQGREREVILEAEELLDADPACSEALFYLGEALLQIGDAEGALQAFDQHVSLEGAPSIRVRIGLSMAHFELCDLISAELYARQVLKEAPDEAQAYFGLGLILELKSKSQGAATAAFVAANRLAPDNYPFPIHLEKEQWKHCVELALQQTPKNIRNFWDGLPVHLFESPDISELRAAEPPLSPRVLGLYIGVAAKDLNTKPEGLRLFTRNLSRSLNHAEVIQKIATTLEQEALDWLADSPLDSQE